MQKFNKEQLCAIRHGDGPMMVLAGPGSGKTTVLVNRVRYLTEELSVAEGSILVITFTRAAAAEMKERYLRLGMNSHISSEKEGSLGSGKKAKTVKPATQVTFGTFHSVFFSFLRERLGYGHESVAEAKQCRELMWEILSRELSELSYTSDMAEVILSELSSRKNGVSHRDHPVPEAVLSRISKHYELGMRRLGLLDFDDMLLRFLELLRSDGRLLHELRQKFRYIMVDEFQDINPVQYEIVRLLCEPLRNIFIVGDDDQSIYGFRGSEPGIMLGFPQDFPELKKVILDTNYRSGSNIVRASLRLIERNKSRYEKKLHASEEHSLRGRQGHIHIRRFKNERQEAEAVVSELRKMLIKKGDDMDAAVLYRVHRMSGALTKLMKQEGLYGYPGIRLMTFHGAKGLEFDTVFIISANEGITPWRLALCEQVLEEERRMFYVAATRAKNELHIFNTKLLYSKDQKCSRFVREIGGSWLFRAGKRLLTGF